jgi:AraC-like DNA-binding protein
VTLATLNLIMIYRTYVPPFPLSQFVDWFWFYEGYEPEHRKERLLPNGAMELVIDLYEKPKRLFDRRDQTLFRSYRRSWISGTHSEFIVIEAAPHSSMMGIHFKPGGAFPFFSFPLTELKDSVIELEAIWGGASIDLRDQLIEEPNPAGKFRILEAFLLGLVRKPLVPARAASFALQRFCTELNAMPIRAVADQLGMSQKHFIEEFSKVVGVTPKLFCRIRRFQRVIQLIEQQKRIEWADISCSCGYYDQPHFIRDFYAFSGLNPSVYLTYRGEYMNFVPIWE